jgi:hypothetical protein
MVRRVKHSFDRRSVHRLKPVPPKLMGTLKFAYRTLKVAAQRLWLGAT